MPSSIVAGTKRRPTLTTYRLRVDPAIYATFPDYAGLAIYARGLHNGPSDAASLALLAEESAACRAAFGQNKAASHPNIVAWREAFARFGSKPSKYPCSPEALISRVLRGNDLPAINRVVDLYNAISVRYVLPIGGEDWDMLTSDGVLTFARGDEPFVELSGGVEETSYPDPGEVIWADSSGITCRRWNWRQCRRTRLTEATTNAYFILDSLPPFSQADLLAAGNDLAELLRGVSAGCAIEMELLRA